MVSIWTPILILSSLPVSSPASGSSLCFQILWHFFFERKTKDSIAYIPLSGIITPIKVLVSGYNIVQMSCFVVWLLQGLGGEKPVLHTNNLIVYMCVHRLLRWRILSSTEFVKLSILSLCDEYSHTCFHGEFVKGPLYSWWLFKC